MPFYETVFIARQDLSDAQVKELTDNYQKIITDNGGSVHKTENWGLRTLAYRINKNRRGHYVMMETDAPAPAIHEMERTMRLNENVLRFMTIKLEELTDEPSIMVAKPKDSDEAPRSTSRRGAA